MMMVLSVVAAAAVLGWAMLSGSTIRSQVDANVADATEAQYLAESGVSYALYYLRNPAKSPVGLTQGPNGTYYAGQSGLKFWSDARGTVDVLVYPTADYNFTVTATAAVGKTVRKMQVTGAWAMQGFPVVVAAGFNNDFTVTSTMRFDGPFVLKGTFSGPASSIVNSPPPVGTGANVVPATSEIALFAETGVAGTSANIAGATQYDRTYTCDGNTYLAEKAPTTIAAALVSARPTLNPKNVWYSDVSVTINGGVSFTGTLVVRNGQTLTVQGINTITAVTGMPAIVAKRVDLKNTTTAPAKLTVNGVLFAGDKISTSGTTRSDGLFKVNGALLMDGTAKIENITSPVQVTYTSSVASVKNLTTTKYMVGVNLSRWASVD